METLAYFLFGSVNLSYYLAHANGKKYIRLFSACALYALVIHNLINPPDGYNIWSVVVGMLSVMDTIVDWHAKIKSKKE